MRWTQARVERSGPSSPAGGSTRRRRSWATSLLFGSADGWVYCLRAADGVLAWRFHAAPTERRVMNFDQVESAWPVHGSVLVHDGLAYVAAGRSTYLDGGIRLYALEPATGTVRHQTTLAGPFPDGQTTRDVSFHIPGANSDVLVSEGGAIYLRQKRLTRAAGGTRAGPLLQGREGCWPARVLDRGTARQLLVQPRVLDVCQTLARLSAGQPGAQERPTAGGGRAAYVRRERLLSAERPQYDVLSRPRRLSVVRGPEPDRAADRGRTGGADAGPVAAAIRLRGARRGCGVWTARRSVWTR